MTALALALALIVASQSADDLNSRAPQSLPPIGGTTTLTPQTTAPQTAAPQTRPAAPAQAPQTVRPGSAAATLADPFGDRPAPPPPSAAAPSASQAETALRAAITAFQAGAPNYAAMTPGLAQEIRPREAEFVELIQRFGALSEVRSEGSSGGGHLFLAVFENMRTEWLVNIDDQGKVAGLRFRPAES